MKRWVLNPSLNCPRLMKADRRCVDSEFQTVEAAMRKLHQSSRVLVRAMESYVIAPIILIQSSMFEPNRDVLSWLVIAAVG